MFTAEEIKVANATSRNLGAVGARAITPRYVEEIACTAHTILDFGAGKAAAHARRMNERGLNVTAYEFGDNVVEGVHDRRALEHKYDIVYASNVLNVQSSVKMLGNTLELLAKATKTNGILVVNYPLSPRKGVMETVDSERLIAFLKGFFADVRRVGGKKDAPLLRAEGVKP